MITNSVKVKDFRNTSYKDIDFTLGNKKIEFMNYLKLHHPKAWNIYSYANNKTEEYNKIFRNIYHDKCAYCGISTQVLNSSNFEVDHVIPKFVLKLNKGYDKKVINGIDNLVNSCQMCNRGKQSFLCEEEILEKIHPDNNYLPYIFIRNADYTIEVNNEYKDNEVIKDFYIKLKLDNQLRRLDYLLMEMKDFCDKYEGEDIINEIRALIFKIESKRRKNY